MSLVLVLQLKMSSNSWLVQVKVIPYSLRSSKILLRLNSFKFEICLIFSIAAGGTLILSMLATVIKQRIAFVVLSGSQVIIILQLLFHPSFSLVWSMVRVYAPGLLLILEVATVVAASSSVELPLLYLSLVVKNWLVIVCVWSMQ